MSNSTTSSTHTNAFRNWSLIQRLHHPTFAHAKSGVDSNVVSVLYDEIYKSVRD